MCLILGREEKVDAVCYIEVRLDVWSSIVGRGRIHPDIIGISRGWQGRQRMVLHLLFTYILLS